MPRSSYNIVRFSMALLVCIAIACTSNDAVTHGTTNATDPGGTSAGSGHGGTAGTMARSHGMHSNLPAAPSMLNVEPWDGRLTLAEFTDENPSPDIVEVSLTAAPATVEYVPGHSTRAWAYNGRVPGPVLRAKVGDKVIVHLKNALPEATTIHWHGMRVPSAMDGTTAMQSPVGPNESFDYEFTALDAGTFWYHPHVRSDVQVENGLYGAIVIEDPAEPLADMPDEVMMLSDVLVDPTTYEPDDAMNDRMMMMGREGNLLLVNGMRMGMQMPVRAGEPHRMRIINAATSRFFRLMLDGGTMVRVGGDRGLIAKPEPMDEMMLVGGERADVIMWANQPGTPAMLQAMPYERAAGAGATEVVRMMDMMASEENALPAMDLPTSLVPMRKPDPGASERTIMLGEQMVGNMVEFMINDASYPNVPRIAPKRGQSEMWKVVNDSDMDHPFHMHGFFFMSPDGNEWKDTINIPGKQTVMLMPDFDDREGAQGSWMYHCHILGHAEGGMMGEMDVN